MRITTGSRLVFASAALLAGLLGASPARADGDLRKVEHVMDLADRIDKKDAKKRDLFDVKLLHLAHQIQLYLKIMRWETPYVVPPTSAGETTNRSWS